MKIIPNTKERSTEYIVRCVKIKGHDEHYARLNLRFLNKNIFPFYCLWDNYIRELDSDQYNGIMFNIIHEQLDDIRILYHRLLRQKILDRRNKNNENCN